MSEQTTVSSTARSGSAVTKRGQSSLVGNASAQLVFGVILILIVAASGFLWYWQNKLSGYDKQWQAVFLTNGQVYFGEVTKTNTKEVVMEDIYYLQVTRPLQQAQDGEEPANPQGELSLVKLGNELHRPTDKMYVNRDHILFIEDLKEDSNVVQAIINYKNGQ